MWIVDRRVLVVVVGVLMLAGGCSRPRSVRGLASAANDGDLATVEYLLDKYEYDLDRYDPAGFTALQNAAARGHLEIVEVLFDAGTDPTKPTEQGDSPLEGVAGGTGSVEVGRWLVEHGADPCVEPSEWLVELTGIDSYAEYARGKGNDRFAEFLEEVTAACSWR